MEVVRIEDGADVAEAMSGNCRDFDLGTFGEGQSGDGRPPKVIECDADDTRGQKRRIGACVQLNAWPAKP